MSYEKSSRVLPVPGEFYLAAPSLKVFAPISLSDAEGEKLAGEILEAIEMAYTQLKVQLEEKFPNVRVGFDIQ